MGSPKNSYQITGKTEKGSLAATKTIIWAYALAHMALLPPAPAAADLAITAATEKEAVAEPRTQSSRTRKNGDIALWFQPLSIDPTFGLFAAGTAVNILTHTELEMGIGAGLTNGYIGLAYRYFLFPHSPVTPLISLGHTWETCCNVRPTPYATAGVGLNFTLAPTTATTKLGFFEFRPGVFFEFIPAPIACEYRDARGRCNFGWYRTKLGLKF